MNDDGAWHLPSNVGTWIVRQRPCPVLTSFSAIDLSSNRSGDPQTDNGLICSWIGRSQWVVSAPTACRHTREATAE
jgi:hypothetical protein